MKAQVEFLPDGNGAIQSIIVDADEIDKRNGFLVAWKGESIVFVANEKFVKFCVLFDDSNPTEKGGAE